VHAEALEHHGVEIRHGTKALAGAFGGDDLATQLVLDLRLVDEVGKGPLEAGRHRPHTGTKELQHKAHQLAVSKLAQGIALVVVGNAEIKE
jgi:hypothetical protein